MARVNLGLFRPVKLWVCSLKTFVKCVCTYYILVSITAFKFEGTLHFNLSFVLDTIFYVKEFAAKVHLDNLISVLPAE